MSITWGSIAAMAGFAALAIPLLVHLFAQTPVRRVVVPSVRLLVGLSPQLRRRRRIRDPWLLAVRMAIIAAAVAGAAGPLVLTPARESGWAGRVVRAVIVDRSASASTPETRAAIDAAARDETEGALASVVIDADRLASALPQALTWLNAQAPASQEIVFVGDGQAGSFDASAVGQVPPHVGLRIRTVEGRPLTAEVAWLGSVSADGRVSSAALRLDAARETRTDVLARPVPALPVEFAVGDDPGARVVRAVWDGILADGVMLRVEDTWQRVRIVSGARRGAETPGVSRLSAPHREPLLPLVAGIAGADPGAGPAAGPATDTGAEANTGAAAEGPWTTIVPGVSAASQGDAVVLALDLHADLPTLERVLRAVVDLAVGMDDLRELEPRRESAAFNAAMQRAPRGLTPGASRHADSADGRWLWLVAVILLVVEGLVRRRVARGRAGPGATA